LGRRGLFYQGGRQSESLIRDCLYVLEAEDDSFASVEFRCGIAVAMIPKFIVSQTLFFIH
jgi:hypothetical protein